MTALQRKSVLFLQLRLTSILVDHGMGGIGKFISFSFHAYVAKFDFSRTRPVCQFEGKVVLDSELNSKSDLVTSNWIGSPPCCACSMGSSAPSSCPTCPSWSMPWFLIIIKSLGSNLSSRSLADEHKNDFTWQFNHCARDLVIGPCIVGVFHTSKLWGGKDHTLQFQGGLVIYKSLYDLSWFGPLLGDNSPTYSDLILKMNICYKGWAESSRSLHG
jgi:hypothetical protein